MTIPESTTTEHATTGCGPTASTGEDGDILEHNARLIAETVRLRKRVERERRARAEAEAIAESGMAALYKKQREVELLRSVAVSANEALLFTEALQATLHHVCTYTGWPVGHAYLPDPVRPEWLISSGLWHLDGPVRYEGFREASHMMRFRRGEGLPGMALAEGRPQWLADVSRSADFLRAESAQRHGLHASFALPALVDGECVAVLEFFMAHVREEDESLLKVMEHIADQLARVVERERTAERIHRLAYHDTLTALPNRRLLRDRLDGALAQTQRYGRSLGILFLDLDRFKVVNDSLGHQSGDDLLRQVAARLLGCVRSGDTVARPGGDEFVVLLPEVEGEGDMERVAGRVLDAMRPPFQLSSQMVYVTFSVGGSLCLSGGSDSDDPSGGVDADDLLKHADLALYRAKQSGRNRYVLFTPQMAAKARQTLSLETSLRRALSDGEFVLHYQPQIDTVTGEVIGAEALVRWLHPQLGMVAPQEFIPLAEETGLIVPLGAWVLRSACTQAEMWWRAGLRRISVSVNLSLRQFQQPDLVAQVREILAQTGLDPTLLDLEVTESVAVGDLESTVSTLRALKGLGVSLSLDDFGTGYSSLSSLALLPIDTVKVDKSFVRTMLTEPRNAAIVTSIIHMAHGLDMRVVAEGVENPQQQAFLAEHRCQVMQGYLFSKPVDAQAMTRILSEGGDQAEYRGKWKTGQRNPVTWLRLVVQNELAA